MMLTTKGRYAVMAMVDLARNANGSNRPVGLADISNRQSIALTYLEQIFMKLKKSGIVRSVRGPGGGYVMARPTDETWISDIILAVDESIKMTRCASHTGSGCLHDKTRCMTHDLWEGLENQIYNYLRSVSLQDIIERKVTKAMPFMHMPVSINNEGAVVS